MKKIMILIVVTILPLLMIAQETETPKFGIAFSGFVRNDITLNSRQVTTARSHGDILLAPKPISLDPDGKDINGSPNFNIVGFTTRLRGKISGPEAFGAKTSGMIEMDFVGPNVITPFAVRLRHAFVKLDWKKSQLLTGQFWHPMWATECYPTTVAFGAGLPFNPLSRNPQVRYTYKIGKISLLGAILSHGMFVNKGEFAASQNSAIPEMHAQLQYKNELISMGVGVNYQVLKPTLVTDSSYATCETISSMSYFGYLKFSLKPVTIKLYSLYGQNNDNMVMMGGYAVTDKVYTQEQIDKGFVEYTPYNTLTSWFEVETTGKKVKFGLFAGVSQNMGAKDSVITSEFVGRWGNVNKMIRIAPRVKYITGKIKLGLEFEYSAIDYAEQALDVNNAPVVGSDIGGIDKYGKVTNYKTADNIRLLITVAYLF